MQAYHFGFTSFKPSRVDYVLTYLHNFGIVLQVPLLVTNAKVIGIIDALIHLTTGHIIWSTVI